MSSRMISVARVSGGCTWLTPAGATHSPGVACSSSQPLRWSTPSPVRADTIAGRRSKGKVWCSAWLARSSPSFFLTASTLLSTSAVCGRRPPARSSSASSRPSRPRKRPTCTWERLSAPSTTTSARSALRTASHRARCSAGTSGPSAPGASMNSTWVRDASSVMYPSVFSRVVWILSETAETRWLIRRFKRVDFPALVGPIRQHFSARARSGLCAGGNVRIVASSPARCSESIGRSFPKRGTKCRAICLLRCPGLRRRKGG
mmetsp:Transcript_50302/g.100156  ORF Transcript_50302/g.100156 Transcript_50302/m.100156 type:complete len:261 (+) Transcript_50302:407-1189(+)